VPLYIDLHKFPRITIDEAKRAHVADEAIQEKYGVKYHQFWVNEQAGSLFCLVEGPDKQTVEEVHRLAHGHVACAVVEVDPKYYALVMGTNVMIDGGLVREKSGEVDLGYRTILVVSVRELQGYVNGSASKRRQYFHDEIVRHMGRNIELAGDDRMAAVFNSAEQAVQCARHLAGVLKADENLSYSIGLSAGEPVTEENGFIEAAIRTARNLCYLAGDRHILMSALAHELAGDVKGKEEDIELKFLSLAEETFLADLFNVLDKRLFDEDFTIESLAKDIGISRPQLYRKIHSLTGRSPNNLIRDLRLEKAMSMLKRKTGNISEIAFKVGFNNPSYFAKCFAEKFGYLPSELRTAE
jgi:AraC-like DNA-binding protein